MFTGILHGIGFIIGIVLGIILLLFMEDIISTVLKLKQKVLNIFERIKQ